MFRGTIIALAVVLAAATLGLWIYSVSAPSKFGVCHTVALYQGTTPSVRDCEPYEVALFAVPIGLLAIIVPLLLYVAGDANVAIPFFGKNIVLSRRLRDAKVVFEEGSDLDQRGAEWLETLEEKPGS